MRNSNLIPNTKKKPVSDALTSWIYTCSIVGDCTHRRTRLATNPARIFNSSPTLSPCQEAGIGDLGFCHRAAPGFFKTPIVTGGIKYLAQPCRREQSTYG